MRIMGHNVLAIFVAALAIYLIGFLIYGLLVSEEQYMAMAGISEDDVAGAQWKMPLGVIMPILIAIGLSLVVKWRGKDGWMAGAMAGLSGRALLSLRRASLWLRLQRRGRPAADAGFRARLRDRDRRGGNSRRLEVS